VESLPKKFHVVLGVTGSIAAYKAADIIRRFREFDALRPVRVSVVMTSEATEFITPLTLASLSGEDVLQDMFHPHRKDWAMHHIALGQQSDLILIAPATAQIIGKIACGIADDLLTCTVMAAKVPVFLAPAMNEQMYRNPLIQENCRKLKALGYSFIGPVEGGLACGTFGVGHLADVNEIVSQIMGFLSA
jgi:phosphopantothenoylcysteine decarboxylase/phosphopantothenate--cysteine ligase